MSTANNADVMEVAETTIHGQCKYCPQNPGSCTGVAEYGTNNWICTNGWGGFNENDWVTFSYKLVHRDSCCMESDSNTAVAYGWAAWNPPNPT